MNNLNLMQMQSLIFFTRFNEGWQTKWDILSCAGETFDDLDEAIDFIRFNGHLFTSAIGLATFNQMQMGNAEWNNL